MVDGQASNERSCPGAVEKRREALDGRVQRPLGRLPRRRRGATLPARWLAALVVAGLGVTACGDPPPPRLPSAPSARELDHPNWVCRGLIGHFISLPSQAGDAGGEPESVTGCWWIRGCELGLSRAATGVQQIEVHLDGLGWYWIDFDEGGFQLHQQVPFELGADLAGSMRFGYSGGVASFWFEPTREPRVTVDASAELDLRGSSLWGSVVRHIPLLPLRQMTAERLSDAAAAAFASQLRRGVTATYDVMKGQADMALGALAPGETPTRVFEDDTAWIENTRLLLPWGSTHAFGPLEGQPMDLDAMVERGPGIRYQTLCVADMQSCFDAVAAGEPERIPPASIVDSGTLMGAGTHITRLPGRACQRYLVVASAADETTVVALRLRAGMD